MSYRHLSGFEKRQKKKKKDIEAIKQKGALMKYITTETNLHCYNNADSEIISATTSEPMPDDVLTKTISIELPENNETESKTNDSTHDAENEINDIGLISPQYIENTNNNHDSLACATTQEDKDFTNTDLALWPNKVPKEMQFFYLKNKPHSNIEFINSSKTVCVEGGVSRSRCLTINVFNKTKANGETAIREWLIYSPISFSVYCYICKLFSNKQSVFKEGYKDWKNVSSRVNDHENSKDHIDSVKIFIQRNKSEGRIDTDIEKAYNEEKRYWRKVLQRVVATIKFLSKCGLAFRGAKEDFNKSVSVGNYISALEYLSEFDDFIAEHIKKYCSKGKGQVNYLSSTICDEFIQIMGKELLKSLTNEVKRAKYFSIIVDSTPDVTHVDQLTFIIRYLNKDGEPVEHFFGFLPIYSHTGEAIEEVILKYLEQLEVDKTNCRGQSYDNAANMAGKYNGVQARIKEICSNAHYIPCFAHSLNLIGNSAAESSLQGAKYFNIVENIYEFFSSSTYRWNILEKQFSNCNKHLNVKKLCDTRWSSRADAIDAIHNGQCEIMQALSVIANCETQKPAIKLQANSLIQKMESLEFSLMTIIWYKILKRINNASKVLQDTSTILSSAILTLNSLFDFINDYRTKYDDIELEAVKRTRVKDYKMDMKRKIKRKKMNDESKNTIETDFTGKNDFKVNCFYKICDVICSEITRRSEGYKNVNNIFQILFIKNEHFSSSTASGYTKNLKEFYKNDIDILEVDDEFVQFFSMIKDENLSNPLELLRFININNIVSIFPNIEILLRIYLTLPISNASGERSFSVLKRVKDYQRNKLGQEKLCNLSLLYIENDEMNNLDCDLIIDKFSEMKIRKKSF